jgi:hypothetical protein
MKRREKMKRREGMNPGASVWETGEAAIKKMLSESLASEEIVVGQIPVGMISAHGHFSDLAGIAVLVYNFDIIEITRDAVERVLVAGFDDPAAKLIPSPTTSVGRRKVEMINRKPGLVDDHELASLRLDRIGADGQ